MPYPPLRTGSRSEADSAKDRTTAPVAGSICTRVAGSLSIRHKRFRLGSNVRSSVLSLNAWGEMVAPGTRVPSVLRLLSSATEEAADTRLLNQRFVPSKATPVITRPRWIAVVRLDPSGWPELRRSGSRARTKGVGSDLQRGSARRYIHPPPHRLAHPRGTDRMSVLRSRDRR